jgi:hypothetical protein
MKVKIYKLMEAHLSANLPGDLLSNSTMPVLTLIKEIECYDWTYNTEDKTVECEDKDGNVFGLFYVSEEYYIEEESK